MCLVTIWIVAVTGIVGIAYKKWRPMVEAISTIASVVFASLLLLTIAFYYLNRPTIAYHVGIQLPLENKKKDPLARMGALDIRPLARSGLLSGVYVAAGWPGAIGPTQGSSDSFSYKALEEVPFGIDGYTGPIQIGRGEEVFSPKSNRVFFFDIHPGKDAKTAKIKIILYTRLDPMKYGLVSIFHPLFNYRFSKEIILNLESMEPIEGKFDPL